jgi:hypothetical protein
MVCTALTKNRAITCKIKVQLSPRCVVNAEKRLTSAVQVRQKESTKARGQLSKSSRHEICKIDAATTVARDFRFRVTKPAPFGSLPVRSVPYISLKKVPETTPLAYGL